MSDGPSTTILDAIYGASRAYGVQRVFAVRLHIGRAAWIRLIQAIDREPLLAGLSLALSPDPPMMLFGLAVVVRADRHPDYLAIEYDNGATVPVVESWPRPEKRDDDG